MEVLKLFVPYGPAWLGGVLLALIAFYFGTQAQKLHSEAGAKHDDGASE